MKEGSRQPLSVQLYSRELNQLVIDLNRSIAKEEQLRYAVMDQEKEVRDMIANISHDLRTPLTSIKGYLQLMKRASSNLQDQEAFERNLMIVQKHSDELGDLIEHFYEYSYLLDNDKGPELERVNLTNLDQIDVGHLFERFYAGSHARKSTGLGLAIVKLLAEQMGGSASAQIIEGELEFRVSFLACSALE